MNGIIFPSEGEYLYKGHAITEKALKDRKFAKWFHQQMGYVFQNPAAEAYAVQSIPSNFLIRCSDGQIVATQLRGEALGEKLGELLGD